ncbi:MAG: DUF504 domain-containing protein [Methanomassiliicoccales archaeon]|nr:DUF504 domain-containing protein [Methanomassiliicoccales archaeon]
MPYPREVLNGLRWSGEGLEGVLVTYVHRGAPGDRLTIRGEDITELGRSFFRTGRSCIPYHRISRIERGGEVVYRA